MIEVGVGTVQCVKSFKKNKITMAAIFSTQDTSLYHIIISIQKCYTVPNMRGHIAIETM